MNRRTGVTLGVERVREGHIVFCPGPPDIQSELDRVGDVGVGHVAIVIRDGDTWRIVEAGPKGCKSRSLNAVVRHHGTVQVASLEFTAAEVERLIAYARASLVTDVRYSNGLLNLSKRWRQVRGWCPQTSGSTPAPASSPAPGRDAALRAMHQIAAFVAARIPRPGVTCSTYVFDALTYALDEDRLGVRLDRPSATPPRIGASCGLSHWLSSPGDLLRSPLIARTFDLCASSMTTRAAA